MRELKFRALHTRDKDIVYFDDMYWFEHNYVRKNGDDGIIVQQWTGIADKNGKDIYEGDILNFAVHCRIDRTTSYIKNAEVRYSTEYLQYVFGEEDWSLMDSIPETLEVVGNIYEK